MIASATNSEKRRKRRIAADEAHSWARNLRLGNPYAKMVLTALSLYVNGDGICYVAIGDGVETGLAFDTELSPDTVRKRLAWLEQIGAVARFAQWLDAAGKRNGDGRGKRTSDEIRLLIDADQDEIEARAKGHNTHASEPECNNINPSPEQGLISEVNIVSPLVAPCQPSDSGEGLDSSEPEPEILSQSPIIPSDEEESRPKEEDDKEFEATFQQLARNYPIPIDDVLTVRRLLAALDPQEREDAVIGALGYRYFVRDEKRRPWNATKFLRQRRWPGYVQLGQAKMPKPPPPRYFIREDSLEYQGLLVIYAIIGQPAPRPEHSMQHGCKGVFRNREPNAALVAMAKVHGLPIDTAIVEKTKRWNAWRERMTECSAWMPVALTLRKFGEEQRDKENRIIKLPKIIRGARFPSCWPPTKGEAKSERAA